jgi:hypothetical protein
LQTLPKIIILMSLKSSPIIHLHVHMLFSFVNCGHDYFLKSSLSTGTSIRQVTDLPRRNLIMKWNAQIYCRPVKSGQAHLISLLKSYETHMAFKNLLPHKNRILCNLIIFTIFQIMHRFLSHAQVSKSRTIHILFYC